ncbi:haloalkane dehalogenase [Actinomycetospora endophytica]|uniref:Haloalkane dehalogenase n=1 Tax=Actinomycetospora endophytica TaxID=2291215 RepID=A0ABS8P2E0_9PSEU|nr:haloalkane dehalogenase [Actinomycetospora endophytica]MCD2192421.1 haloalkane dehalogenase [Actinomycetospora endophytica]
MRLLRTPDDRFTGLDGFAHPPRFVEVADPDGGPAPVRVATYAVGPQDAGPTVLLLHGEPTWSYLYRHVLDALAGAGVSAVAVDLVGFGRSDKPAEITDHSYARHVAWVQEAVFGALGLDDLVLLGQDWGGLIGLRLVAAAPERFRAVVAANTGLPTGDVDMPEPWWQFRRAVERAETLDVGRLVASGCARGLEPAARAAYDAPFPDESYKSGPRAMPLLVPTRPDDPETAANRAAWAALADYRRPFVTAFSDSDPITGPMGPVLRDHVPGAGAGGGDGPGHAVLRGAGHFLQEDAGAELASVVVGTVRLVAR